MRRQQRVQVGAAVRCLWVLQWLAAWLLDLFAPDARNPSANKECVFLPGAAPSPTSRTPKLATCHCPNVSKSIPPANNVSYPSFHSAFTYFKDTKKCQMKDLSGWRRVVRQASKVGTI